METPSFEEVWHVHIAEGISAFQDGHYHEAERHFQSAVVLAGFLWPDSPRLAGVVNQLGRVYTAQGRYVEAEPLHREALLIVETVQGRLDIGLVPILESYADLLRRTNRVAEAEKLERRAKLLLN